MFFCFFLFFGWLVFWFYGMGLEALDSLLGIAVVVNKIVFLNMKHTC